LEKKGHQGSALATPAPVASALPSAAATSMGSLQKNSDFIPRV